LYNFSLTIKKNFIKGFFKLFGESKIPYPYVIDNISKIFADETGLAIPFAVGSGIGNEINDIVVEKQNDAILLV
jgi:hypothetical protein